MSALLPHIQQATDVMRRLGSLTRTQSAFQLTLDWLVDGVVMLAVDGAVRYANVAAQAIFRANDGLAVRRGMLKLASADAMAKLGEAMKAVSRLRDSEVDGEVHQDFIVARRSGATAYSISVRPLLAAANEAIDVVALIFIRDPLAHRRSSAQLLSQMFGLTTAEAALANALCSGMSPDEFARENKISRNTVYTHIRHLKEKTGSSRMTELIRKLNDVQASVVAAQE
jgi:DNA-binding CsgD family transcriptional regulator